MQGTFLASTARLLWRLLEQEDINPLQVFRDAGLDPALMDQPRARYPVTRVTEAVLRAEQLTGNPCMGLDIANIWRAPDHHALGYAFLASSTLRTALMRFVRYFKVINDATRFILDEDDEQVHIRFEWLQPGIGLPQAVEDARWAGLTVMCREASGGRVNPVEVRFTHPEPECRARHFGFFCCPVQFGAESARLSFARTDIDRPLPASNRELAHSNDRILAAFVRTMTEDGLISRVKAALLEELPSGNPGDENIARAVYLSPRTLQRRLAEAGTSYSILLSEVRRELAERYIVDPSIPLNEVSYLLGFSELSAFSRAFKRWTGRSPTSFRGNAA